MEPEAILDETDTSIEVMPAPASLRQQIETLTSPESFEHELAQLKQELSDDADYCRLAEIWNKARDLESKAVQASKTKDKIAFYDQANELDHQFSHDPRYKDYELITRRIFFIEEIGTRLVGDDSQEAKTLLATLYDEVGALPLDDSAPFFDYKNNNLDAWKYVPDAAIKDYLRDRRFVNTTNMHLDGPGVRIQGNIKDEPLSVPASIFVSAAGLDSWVGRGIDGSNEKSWRSQYGASKSSSIDTIKHYASLETEIPPVELVNVYIQPDGRIFANNSYADSHRIAAAFLRGYSDIKANNIEFIKLDENVI